MTGGELKMEQWGHKGVKPWMRSKQTERIRGGYVEHRSWTTDWIARTSRMGGEIVVSNEQQATFQGQRQRAGDVCRRVPLTL